MNISTKTRQSRFLLIVLLSLLAFANPRFAQADDNILALTSKEVNKSCPINLGIVGTMTSTEYRPISNTFVYNINLDPANATLEQLAATGTTVMKNNIKTALSQSSFRPFINMLIDNNAQLCANFKQGNKNPITILFSTDELREMVNTKRSDRSLAEEALKNSVSMENSRYPQNLGNGMVMMKAFCDDHQIVYECQIDPSIITADNIASSEDRIKQAMLNMMGSDLGMASFCKNAVTAGYSIRYHYYEAGTNRHHDIIITPADLSKIL